MSADSAAALADEPQPRYEEWFDLGVLDDTDAGQPHNAYRRFLQHVRDDLAERYWAGDDIIELIHGRSWAVDQVLRRFWNDTLADCGGALIAVGGYGRRELMPGSDVDIMVLLARAEDASTGAKIERFLTMLWDIGLEVGHSVRTLQECQDQARDDITVATNMMEARLLCGSGELFEEMRIQVGPTQIWPSAAFFAAKREEQEQRYARFDDAVYNLEPNVKEGPGGLRDGQMIAWIFKRHFGSSRLKDLISRGLITDEEYTRLMDSQRFLWRVRFGLHQITGRREERLLFDHQRTLAKRFGYQDSEQKLAVESFMQDYYLAVRELSHLNELLLQLFDDVLCGDEEQPATNINRRFQARGGFLEVTYPTVFQHYPFAMLELFLVLQQHPELKGVRASTIRLLDQHRHLIDEDFRNDIACRSLFMEIFRQPRGLTHELRRMNRYGILAAYYPPFEKIVAQMQHDLFHVYTVDEHTLFVIRNLRRFTVDRYSHEFPLASRVVASIPKLELLYLAGFFHDIAKGRGGDHSELGATEARSFLARHGLSKFDQNLVAWLVKNHLLMSTTSQRRDISDPEVIHEFASLVGDRWRLDYLYLLTVADICGTSPTLWNGWKDALLRELYLSTRRTLSRGLENPLHREELINDIKNAARAKLADKGVEPAAVQALWKDFPDDYFLRHKASEVMWHAETILGAGQVNGTCVELQPRSERGGSALFIYTPINDRLFSLTTALLDQLGLNVTEARIISTARGYAADTYQLLDASGAPLTDRYLIQELVTLLREDLQAPEGKARWVSRPTPRRLRHFKVDTRVNFRNDEAAQRTVVELYATDYPGLLSRLGRVFYETGVDLHNAKISTIGSRAEDVFFVTDREDRPLDPGKQDALRDALIQALDSED